MPDTIKDEWIDDIESLGEKMDEHIHAQKEATGFDLRYTTTMKPSRSDWRACSDVLSREGLAQLRAAADSNDFLNLTQDEVPAEEAQEALN